MKIGPIVDDTDIVRRHGAGWIIAGDEAGHLILLRINAICDGRHFQENVTRTIKKNGGRTGSNS